MDAGPVKIQVDSLKKSIFLTSAVRIATTALACSLVVGVLQDQAAAQERTSNDTLLKEVARLRADLKQIREDQVKLLARIEDNRKQVDALMRQMQQLELRLTATEQSDSGIGRIQHHLDSLQRALQQEVAARKEADSQVIKTVSEEIAGAMNQTVARRTADSTASDADIQGEYTVQRGDTLGAIAQAFDTTVKRLKDVNNLQNDLIIEGQKLLIPK